MFGRAGWPDWWNANVSEPHKTRQVPNVIREVRHAFIIALDLIIGPPVLRCERLIVKTLVCSSRTDGWQPMTQIPGGAEIY